MKEVAVIVPIYKETLGEYERVALDSITSQLAAYPIVMVKPERLDISAVTGQYPQLMVESFADEFFAGIAGYNRLMLNTDFYKRFAGYRYILIAQLDTYIFRDELIDWCSKDYDYVGAPWIVRSIYNNPLMRLYSAIKRTYCRLLNKPNSQITGNKVGNGGLSLRKVQSHIEATEKLASTIEKYLTHKRHHLFNEDVFFAIEPNQNGLSWTYPDHMEALRFSFDTHPAYCYNLTGHRLPFGCHSWSKRRMLPFWSPIILQK